MIPNGPTIFYMFLTHLNGNMSPKLALLKKVDSIAKDLILKGPNFL